MPTLAENLPFEYDDWLHNRKRLANWYEGALHEWLRALPKIAVVLQPTLI